MIEDEQSGAAEPGGENDGVQTGGEAAAGDRNVAHDRPTEQQLEENPQDKVQPAADKPSEQQGSGDAGPNALTKCAGAGVALSGRASPFPKRLNARSPPISP